VVGIVSLMATSGNGCLPPAFVVGRTTIPIDCGANSYASTACIMPRTDVWNGILMPQVRLDMSALVATHDPTVEAIRTRPSSTTPSWWQWTEGPGAMRISQQRLEATNVCPHSPAADAMGAVQNPLFRR
jgi:hypothetical protein